VPFSALAAAEDTGEPSVDPARFLPADHERFPGHWAIMPARWPTPEEGLLAGETRAGDPGHGRSRRLPARIHRRLARRAPARRGSARRRHARGRCRGRRPPAAAARRRRTRARPRGVRRRAAGRGLAEQRAGDHGRRSGCEAPPARRRAARIRGAATVSARRWNARRRVGTLGRPRPGAARAGGPRR
jgi:hypothetical protein